MAKLLLLLLAQGAEIPHPVAVDRRLEIQLVAREPDVNTPTSMDVDAKGRIWAIESNTHFPPKGYQGKPTDRILVFDDFAPDGRAKRITTFADGFRYGMSIAVRPDGDVYFATRWQVMILRDTNGDLAMDEKKVIVDYQTKGDYPHNGLCGFAFDAQGNCIFGAGENLGADYKLVGSDGSALAGGGEGGNVYRCRADGSKVERLATGVWNPFHMCFDAFGRLFVVDNDPDSRPPCRLLYVVPGADFGFKYRIGRKGLHPFQAWNGELPGTVPMVAGTAEAPSAVVAYESDGLPSDYRGTLLSTSWGDYVLQRFKLVPRGASFTAQPETFVKGNDQFRPVGMAVAPDGSLVLTDWVDKSYELHGKGRIWRVRSKTPGRFPAPDDEGRRARIRDLWSSGDPRKSLGDPAEEVRGEAVRLLQGDEARKLKIAKGDPSKFVRMQAILGLREKSSLSSIVPALADEDPFLASAAAETLSRVGESAFLLDQAAKAEDPKVRVGLVVAMRRKGDPACRAAVPKLLEDPDPAVRRAAVQWVGEEGLVEHAAALEASASRPPVKRDLFEAFLAAVDFLNAGLRRDGDLKGGDFYLARTLEDRNQPAALRALALRMLPADHAAIRGPTVRELAGGAEPELRREAVRALAASGDPAAQDLLRRIAASNDPLRIVAVGGLAHSAGTPESRALLVAALRDADPEVRMEAARAFSGGVDGAGARDALEAARREGGELAEKAALLLGDPPGRPAESEWAKIGLEPGDAAAGERVFFHAKGPQCYLCHRVDGRGGVAGPDLSTIGNALNRVRLVESILEPSKEVAPMFVNWRFRLRSGAVLDGRILQENVGEAWIVDAKAQVTKVKSIDIEERLPSRISIMPEKLHHVLTRKEFRDLVAFLAGLK
jgi:hypothetical protein